MNACAQTNHVVKDDSASEYRIFQSAAPWSPREEIGAEVAVVYGIDEALPARIATWRDRGYRIHVMTGVSWGHYKDYPRYNEEAQTDRAGRKLEHGGGGGIWYMSPGIEYGRYLCRGIQRALDAGVEAVHLEEPEFWVHGGYEENFRQEWKAYYGEEWQPPHSSPDARYRASKLKSYVYRRALSQIFDYVRDYNARTGRRVRCYVPTHSLISYAQIGIVSPESSLIEVGCDGYIAQVWTGTARVPNTYEGRTQERTFEAAFLEYGAMQNLARASGRRIWYLNDPVEDDPKRTWEDYRYNWEQTLTASLFQSEVHHYEILPWPNRIFRGRYTTEKSKEKTGIPPDYDTELQAVFHAMGEMKQPADTVRWVRAGTRQVGVLISDTMMYQRGDPNPSDARLGSFFGLAMPLLKRGLPVEPVQIETAAMRKEFLGSYRLLLLTYEGQKPPDPKFHDALADWVRAGGALVVVDNDRDPYNAVKEWWNKAPNAFATPRHHLFGLLGLAADATGLHKVGKGVVLFESASPAGWANAKDGADQLRRVARQAAEAIKLPWEESNALILRRGPYVIAATLEETGLPVTTTPLKGRFINLFDAEQQILRDPVLAPGQRRLLLDLDAAAPQGPRLLAAACRVRNFTATKNRVTLTATGTAGSRAVVSIALPWTPRSITLGGTPLAPTAWNFAEGILRIQFTNQTDLVAVEIR